MFSYVHSVLGLVLYSVSLHLTDTEILMLLLQRGINTSQNLTREAFPDHIIYNLILGQSFPYFFSLFSVSLKVMLAS
jgi:hypothetical protein